MSVSLRLSYCRNVGTFRDSHCPDIDSCLVEIRRAQMRCRKKCCAVIARVTCTKAFSWLGAAFAMTSLRVDRISPFDSLLATRTCLWKWCLKRGNFGRLCAVHGTLCCCFCVKSRVGTLFLAFHILGLTVDCYCRPRYFYALPRSCFFLNIYVI